MPGGRPFRFRTLLRQRLPFRMIFLVPKGSDCEASGGTHEWYNHDGARSACYHCKAVADGMRWR